MRKKFLIAALLAMISLLVVSCGKSQKDVWAFLDVKIGDSKEDGKENYGDDWELNQGDIYAYTNIKSPYDCEEQYVSFLFDSDEIIYSINATWTLETADEAKKLFDSLKKKSTKQYGDEYESGKSDNPAEYARWSSDSSIINISLTDDDLNGNKVSINIRKE